MEKKIEIKRIEFNENRYNHYLVIDNKVFTCFPCSFNWETSSIEPDEGFNEITKVFSQKTSGDSCSSNWFKISIEPVENKKVFAYLQGEGFDLAKNIEPYIDTLSDIDILNVQLEKINLK